MKSRFVVVYLGFVILNANALTLKESESVALKQAPELKRLLKEKDAYQHLSIGQSQWMDPMLELGAMNLPTNSFHINQENMTQFKVGVRQIIPKGSSLKFKQIIETIKANKSFSEHALMRIEILKLVRMIWVERIYWRQVRWILLKQRATFNHLVDVTHSLYENNKAQQKDVFNAKMQLSKVHEQIVHAKRAYQATTAKLARWIGNKNASASHPKSMPRFLRLPKLDVQQNNLNVHPLLKKDSDIVALNKAKADLIKEDFKPGFTVGVSYGYRDTMPNGMKRTDFLSIGLGVSLPINKKNKQRENYKASLANVSASLYQKRSDFNKLNELLSDTYVQWLSSGDKVHIYRTKLLPDARSYAKASLISYQNAKLDFPTLANGYAELYKLEIIKQQLRFMQAKQKINLLFLNGI